MICVFVFLLLMVVFVVVQDFFVLFCVVVLLFEQIVVGLLWDDVDIIISFDGLDIIIYGVIKCEMLILFGLLDVIVIVEGLIGLVIVWYKECCFGIWVNIGWVSVVLVLNFYVVVIMCLLEWILDQNEDNCYCILVLLVIWVFVGVFEVEDVVFYIEVLVCLCEVNDLYWLDEGVVFLVDKMLFCVDVCLFVNLIEGYYVICIFFVCDGKVLNIFCVFIEVCKVGLECWLYWLVLEQLFLYGIMLLVIVIFVGWGVLVLFWQFCCSQVIISCVGMVLFWLGWLFFC